MTEIWLNIFFGVVQGVTEWLPVSSSGHLALTSLAFGVEQDLSYDVVLHLASLAVIMLYFRRDLLKLITGVVRGSRPDRQTMWYVVLATAVTIPIAILLKELAESVGHTPLMLASAFVITSVVVGLSFVRNQQRSIGWPEALVLGAVQGCAVIPGISRSGVTIGIAMLLGIDREQAFRFSFFAAIPAIAGAFVYVARDIAWRWEYTAGLVTVLLVGYLSLWLLDRVIRRGWFHFFALYTIVVALLLLAVR